MEVGKILPVEAAAILHASPQFVRVAMQQQKLPIGTAIKMSSIWTSAGRRIRSNCGTGWI